MRNMTRLEAAKRSASYDNMEISGGRAVWKDVLAVYAVKTNTDENDPQEVATMDESKKNPFGHLLGDEFRIFPHRKSFGSGGHRDG